MSEKLEKLIRVANQVGDFFAPYGDEKAVDSIAEHLRSFWTNRMRSELFAYAVSGGAGLHPVVLKAVKRINPADDPAKKVPAG